MTNTIRRLTWETARCQAEEDLDGSDRDVRVLLAVEVVARSTRGLDGGGDTLRVGTEHVDVRAPREVLEVVRERVQTESHRYDGVWSTPL